MKRKLTQKLGFRGGQLSCQCILFLMFIAFLFAKQVLFHYAVFHSIVISSLWKSPSQFVLFYLPKLFVPVFLASFIFVTKHYWWTILVSVVADLWCIANIIYYRTYDAFLTLDQIKLAYNLNGFWSAVTAYIDTFVILLMILTLLWCGVIFILETEYSFKICKRKNLVFVLVVLLTVVCSSLFDYLYYNVFGYTWLYEDSANRGGESSDIISEDRFTYPTRCSVQFPFSEIVYNAKVCGLFYSFGIIYNKEDVNSWITTYVADQSILSYFPAMLIYSFVTNTDVDEPITLSEYDKQEIEHYLNSNSVDNTKYRDNLIIILVESLEFWPLVTDVEGMNVAPNLRRLTECEHVLFCPKLKTQVRNGNSADGQMIIISGLLPISRGVASMHYSNSLYHSFVHGYISSITVNPCLHTWNQDTMSVRYGFSKLVQPEDEKTMWNDEIVMEKTLEEVKKAEEPFCVLAMTFSMHAPFNFIEKQNLHFSEKMPQMMSSYLNSLHYTDSCIGSFMEAILSDERLSSSTVIITGDHTIFKQAMLDKFRSYSLEGNLPIKNGENFTPLIIYSPHIDGNVTIDDVCYQMDVYPTITSLIGVECQRWNGLGVSLLDKETISNRSVSESEAYRISDLIIRGNYFGGTH